MTLLEASGSVSSTAAPDWPRGFLCSGIAAGIKKPGVADLALLAAPEGTSAAGVFTTNLIAAAPIHLSRSHLKQSGGRARALLVNSGCANAATGPLGVERAARSTQLVGAGLGVDASLVQVNSTGVIGVDLPIEKIEAALPRLIAGLAEGSCEPFARAIMTTDTRPKWSSRVIEWDAQGRRHSCRVTGVAKGAGMIHPNMATMIGVIATDARLSPAQLDALLRDSVEQSFHRISVDGDTSTNDSVFAFASGLAGDAPMAQLARAFTEVSGDLAQMVVRDGEGFERGIEVRVEGAATQADALQVARTVAMSLLVRTAVTGGDPNWGRIVAAAGRAGVKFNPDSVRVSAGGILLFADGMPAGADRDSVRRAFTQDTVRISIDLAMGAARDHFWSCGLTKRYVEINADYTT